MIDTIEGLRRIVKTLFGLILISEVVTIIIGIIEVIPTASAFFLLFPNLSNSWESFVFLLISFWPFIKWFLIGSVISYVFMVMIWIIMGFMGIKESIFSSK